VVYADDEVAVSDDEIRHRELPIVLLGMAGCGRTETVRTWMGSVSFGVESGPFNGLEKVR
jgi:hypothetical protein